MQMKMVVVDDGECKEAHGGLAVPTYNLTLDFNNAQRDVHAAQMPLCSPLLANITRLCLITLLIWACLLELACAATQDTNGQDSPTLSQKKNETHNGLLCTPFGACEPCPKDAIHQPFCQPFGNRRLMHCVNSTLSPASAFDSDSDTNHPPSPPPSHTSSSHPEGEILAWESCGRIVSKETADFYEFVAANAGFALIALGIVFFRSRRMQVMHARQLAARIGLIRDDVLGAARRGVGR
ncbi:unnamed protein product [Cyclocybe aegerita]|uniref:Uncharacterized protein n=1 Tax=Cyclocybe aegerita TaxID=1973307 RepID=A0A8S0WXL6_CYCAE|nr:unnamed protein product [Cyclocybe aegerita]